MSANQIENMSLFIPHIFTNVDKNEIQDIIENDYQFGKIKQIDLVSKFNQNQNQTQTHYYNMAYIHFEYWNDTEQNRQFQNKVRAQNNSAKIYYQKKYNKFSEHFWIALENKAKKINSFERKPKLVLEDEDNQNHNQNQTPIQKQMTNKDFSELINAPIKNKNKDENKDENKEKMETINDFIDSCAKKLEFDEEDEQDEQDEGVHLISSDYAQYLEDKIEYLMNLVEFLKKDNINLMNINESLQKENQRFERNNRSRF